MASLNFNKVEEAFRTSLNAVPLRRIFKDYHRWTPKAPMVFYGHLEPSLS